MGQMVSDVTGRDWNVRSVKGAMKEGRDRFGEGGTVEARSVVEWSAERRVTGSSRVRRMSN